MCSFSKLAFKEIVLPSNLKSIWRRSPRCLSEVFTSFGASAGPQATRFSEASASFCGARPEFFFFFLFRCNIKAFISCNDPTSSTQGFMFLWEPYLDEPSRRYADKSFQWSFPCHHVHFHNLLGFCCPWFSRFEEIKCSASGGRSWWRTIGVVWVLYTPGQA